MSYSKLQLIFEGIDTYADVYFNKQHLGSTKNAFLKYEFPIKNYAKVGGNTLQVLINSTKPYDTEQQRKDRMPF
jgi:beta-mannosidase